MKKPKIEKKIQVPESKKRPRLENYYERLIPVWQFSSMDFAGPYGWHPERKIQTPTLLEIRQKLAHFESMTWPEIEGDKHHFSNVSAICKEARNRLAELNQDDIDQLFSLRLSGKQRLWGIRVGAIFKILWWDPDHLVYPSAKKNT